MTKIGVLIPTTWQDELFSAASRRQLDSLAHVVWNDKERQLTEEEACAMLQDCEVAVGTWYTVMPGAAMLDRCPALKLWEHAGGSVKGFFTEQLRGRDIMIASCSPAIANTVAEYVLGALIIGLRRALPNAQRNRSERTERPANLLYLAKATVGVVGASQVGRKVIEFLRPYQSNLLVYDPYLSAADAAALGAAKVESLQELCAASDAVTVHTPKTDATYRLLKAAEFQAMKDDALFINTSRGECVDEEALIGELQKGRLLAFLDVSDPEPALPDNPLRTLPNVVYTSHLAGGGPNIHIGNQVVADIEAYLQGGRPRMVVDWDMLARMA